MGRRQNQLVVEFFQRGKKLENASNRYEHTCKTCGEVVSTCISTVYLLHPTDRLQFAKGRVDAMMDHVLRGCPHVTEQDRQVVYQQLHRPSTRMATFILAAPENALDMDSPTHLTGDHHSYILEHRSALDTLAEASRRHLDYSSHRPNSAMEDQAQCITRPDEGQALAEQALIASLQQHAVSAGYSSQQDTNVFHQTTAEPIFALGTPHSNTHEFESDADIEQSTSAGTSPINLNSAQRFGPAHVYIEPGFHQIPEITSSPVQVDPGLSEVQMSINPQPSTQLTEDTDMMWGPPPSARLHSFGSPSAPVPDSEHPEGFGVLHKGSLKRRRGQFSNTRREEVHANRKRGACLRCRMLKKSCSQGTPCNTCSSIATARVWKDTCIRTRVVDTFPLWLNALYHHKAKVEVPAAVEHLFQIAPPGRMEVSLFAESGMCMSFPAKQYTDVVPVEDRHAISSQEGPDGRTVWLLDKGAEMVDEFQDYVNCIADAYIERETSTCIKAVLREARAIMREERRQADLGETDKTNGANSTGASRSCYALKDQLVDCMVELWVCTRILSDPINVSLRLQYTPMQQPQQQPSTFSPQDVAGVHIIPQQSHSYSLVKSQVLALVEARCMKLSKIIMNEMERRLLQRRQVSPFATFISAMVLLNCVERTTGFYRGFDATTSSNRPATAEEQSNATSVPGEEVFDGSLHGPAAFFHPDRLPTTHSRTSLDKLWLQGERFADLLIMLLRLRGLPPKTAPDASNHLTTLYGMLEDVTGDPSSDRNDNKTLSQWLDPIKLDVAELETKRDGPLPNRDAGLESWDMRFISGVLLPES